MNAAVRARIRHHVRSCFWDFASGKATALAELHRLDWLTPFSSVSLPPREGAVQVNLETLLWGRYGRFSAVFPLNIGKYEAAGRCLSRCYLYQYVFLHCSSPILHPHIATANISSTAASNMVELTVGLVAGIINVAVLIREYAHSLKHLKR